MLHCYRVLRKERSLQLNLWQWHRCMLLHCPDIGGSGDQGDQEQHLHQEPGIPRGHHHLGHLHPHHHTHQLQHLSDQAGLQHLCYCGTEYSVQRYCRGSLAGRLCDRPTDYQGGQWCALTPEAMSYYMYLFM